MAQPRKLADIMTDATFRTIERAFAGNFHLGFETAQTNGRPLAGRCSPDCFPAFCRLVQKAKGGASRCRQDRLRCQSMAFETGQPYISICHAGIVLVCVPIMDQDRPLGGLFLGRCLFEPFDDFARADILKRLKGLPIQEQKLVNAAQQLPVISGRTIHEASEFLFILTYQATQLDPRIIQWRRHKSRQQSQISEFMHEGKRAGADNRQLYENERRLIEMVRIGDKIGAAKVLNAIIGTILLVKPGQIQVLKARLTELLGVLSRSAVEGGADIDRILEKNLEYIATILELRSQDEISAWISRALEDFIDSVHRCRHGQKRSKIQPAIDLMEAHFDEELTLDEIARTVHLSLSRFVHLFREQMGMTVIDYLTGLRINQAKGLLLSTDDSCTEISYAVGFNNQSYFNRIFKRQTGLTPRQFRRQGADNS